MPIKEKSLYYPSKIFDLQLSSLFVNNQEIKRGDKSDVLSESFAYTNQIKLNHSQSTFSIGFSTDNFLHIGGSKIVYRLKGYNDKWSVNRSGNIIVYTNMSPGRYVFEIRLRENPKITKSFKYYHYSPFLCNLVGLYYICTCYSDYSLFCC